MSGNRDERATPVKHVADVTNTCCVCGLDYLDEHISVDDNGAVCLNCKKLYELLSALKLTDTYIKVHTENECISGNISIFNEKYAGIENDTGNFASVRVGDIVRVDRMCNHTELLFTL